MIKLIKHITGVAVLSIFLVSCQDDNGDDNPGSVRDDYLGVWECVENTGVAAPQFYTVNVTAGNGSDKIIINGLYNISGTEVSATIDGLNVSIPSQTSEGISFSGSGQANSDIDQLNLNFTANDGSGNDNVEAVLTR